MGTRNVTVADLVAVQQDFKLYLRQGALEPEQETEKTLDPQKIAAFRVKVGLDEFQS